MCFNFPFPPLSPPPGQTQEAQPPSPHPRLPNPVFNFNLIQKTKQKFSIQKLKSALPGNIKKDNDPRIVTIQALYNSIAPDLQGINAWRYQRQISTGVQEYIEATSFQHYLETQRLITLEEAQASICGGKIVLTEEDYLLGLFDLVGEMMKFAITNMATSGSLPRGGGGSAHLLPSVKRDDDEQQQQEEEVEGGGPKKDVRQTESNGGTANDILTDLRSLRTYFEGLDLSPSGGGGGNGHHLEKDIRQKMEVMKTSVEKVERAVYGIIIRGRERWAPDWGGAENERGRRDQVEIY